jgi:hypothetical protein
MTTNNELVTIKPTTLSEIQSECITRLDSFNSGSGKTCDDVTGFKVSEKISLQGLELRLNGTSLLFQNEAHKNAFIVSMLYRNLKELDHDQTVKLFSHIGLGYLSLNHKDNDSLQKMDYSGLWLSINMTTIERVSVKSKLYMLSFDCTKESITALITAGFIIHSPIMDKETYAITGFNVEYPKA